MKKVLFCVLLALILFAGGCGRTPMGSIAVNKALGSKFEAGIAHVAGNYGFTNSNFLVEGAQKISEFGSDSIFVYLTPWFRSQYPDQSSNSWPAQALTNLAALAQTKPNDSVFNLPFKTIVLTTYTFATRIICPAWHNRRSVSKPSRRSSTNSRSICLSCYLVESGAHPHAKTYSSFPAHHRSSAAFICLGDGGSSGGRRYCARAFD